MMHQHHMLDRVEPPSTTTPFPTEHDTHRTIVIPPHSARPPYWSLGLLATIFILTTIVLILIIMLFWHPLSTLATLLDRFLNRYGMVLLLLGISGLWLTIAKWLRRYRLRTTTETAMRIPNDMPLAAEDLRHPNYIDLIGPSLASYYTVQSERAHNSSYHNLTALKAFVKPGTIEKKDDEEGFARYAAGCQPITA